jgi:hypothetical protein
MSQLHVNISYDAEKFSYTVKTYKIDCLNDRECRGLFASRSIGYGHCGKLNILEIPQLNTNEETSILQPRQPRLISLITLSLVLCAILTLTTKLKKSTSQSTTVLLLYYYWIKHVVDDFLEELRRITQNFDISRPIQTKQISDVPSLLHRSTVVGCSLNSRLSRGEGVQ